MPVRFTNQLKGPNITLKRTKPTLRMAEMMFAVIDHNRDHLKQWLERVASTHKVEDTFKYLFEKEQETKQGKKIEYGIFAGREYICNISLFGISQKYASAEM